MSTVTIPNLPAAGALTGTEVLPIVQSNITSKTTVQDIADLAGGGASFPYTGSAGITGSLDVIGSLENGLSNVVGGAYQNYTISGYTVGQGITLIGDQTSTLSIGNFLLVNQPAGAKPIVTGSVIGFNLIGGNTFITSSQLGVEGVFGETFNINVSSSNNSLNTHAQGFLSQASGSYSHAEGFLTKTLGGYSHAEGYSTTSVGTAAHAEGQNTKSIGSYSHTEGAYTTAIGGYSHAEGYGTTSVGIVSHAEGISTISIGEFSHAEGNQTTAIGAYSHAEGYRAITIGSYSHAEGENTTAIGNSAHAEGIQTTAIGGYSHAEGLGTVTNFDYMHAEGRWNATGSTQDYAYLVVGKGTDNVTRSNAFRVSGSGQCLAASTFTNGGADYAEYFESFNGTSIPLGTVVELTGSFIKPCTIAENAIGVISNKPSVLGNSDEGTSDEWVGKYKKDIWGNYEWIEEEYQLPTGTDEEGNPTFETKTQMVRVLNPNFDPTIPYISRSERPEWNVVGLLGQIKVLNNQPIPSRWIKMGSINSKVDLYFVK